MTQLKIIVVEIVSLNLRYRIDTFTDFIQFLSGALEIQPLATFGWLIFDFVTKLWLQINKWSLTMSHVKCPLL